MDTRTHVVGTVEQVRSFIRDLTLALEKVEAGAAVRHVHGVFGQVDAKGPWEIVITVAM